MKFNWSEWRRLRLWHPRCAYDDALRTLTTRAQVDLKPSPCHSHPESRPRKASKAGAQMSDRFVAAPQAKVV
uniref:Transposase n=1 Tax=Steinernema glaseri TaxID=37863 RepID=A0A1I7XY35_9BILA